MGVFKKMFGRRESHGDERCSVCKRTSSDLYHEYKRAHPGVHILTWNAVGHCPECGVAFCIDHASTVSDPTFGDPVPACPTDKMRLRTRTGDTVGVTATR